MEFQFGDMLSYGIGLMALAGLKPGFWYHKKPKKKKQKKTKEKTRLNVGGGTEEEEIGHAMGLDIERQRLGQGKGRLDYRGGGLLGGGSRVK